MENLVSASLLACNFAKLEGEVKKAENSGVDWIHYDVMDGVFVRNISFGEPVLKSISPIINLPIDAHLMITDPIRYIDNYADLGVDGITFHYEAASDTQAVIDKIRSRGLKVGLSIKPATPVKNIIPYIHEVDMVLVMSVHPGFGGQKFIPESLEKVKQIKAKLIEKGLDNVDIEIDGGINIENLVSVLEAGANVIVAGSAVFKNDAGANVKRFKEIMSTY